MSLEIGAVSRAQWQVGPQDLATIFEQQPQDAFPPVFATAHMIGLMELASARALQPQLKDGELSVGVSLDIQHLAPTAEGETVSASARFTGMEGKLYVFEVSASDAAGEIGRGLHKRAIVARERLLSGAERRKAAALAAQ